VLPLRPYRSSCPKTPAPRRGLTCPEVNSGARRTLIREVHDKVAESTVALVSRTGPNFSRAPSTTAATKDWVTERAGCSSPMA
jgi:hypothetical protein